MKMLSLRLLDIILCSINETWGVLDLDVCSALQPLKPWAQGIQHAPARLALSLQQ